MIRGSESVECGVTVLAVFIDHNRLTDKVRWLKTGASRFMAQVGGWCLSGAPLTSIDTEHELVEVLLELYTTTAQAHTGAGEMASLEEKAGTDMGAGKEVS
jgi:hypothetical protein